MATAMKLNLVHDIQASCACAVQPAAAFTSTQAALITNRENKIVLYIVAFCTHKPLWKCVREVVNCLHEGKWRRYLSF